MVSSYKDLYVWQKSSDLVLDVYKLTSDFPSEEKYGLISQIRRSAVSIPSNISEGSIRRSKKDFTRFVNIASGSAAELQTQLYLSYRLGYLKEKSYKSCDEKIVSILKMLYKLQNSLSEVTYLKESESENYIIEPTKYQVRST